MFSLIPKFSFGSGNLKTLKIRMKTIGSIKKITKAMKMVAASKMRIEVSRMEQGKRFGVGSVQRMLDNESYLQKKKPVATPKKTLIVPITSDKGLCGGVNSSIVREVKSMVGKDHSPFKVFTIGDKGTLALARHCHDILFASISHIATPINFPTASSVGYQVMENIQDCDNVIVVFNEFKNVISQVIKKVNVMTRPFFLKNFKYVTRHESMEPERDYAQHYFYELYLSSIFYNALLNNAACEQSARMNAMENASKNATEVLAKLTLIYNKARQAKITMELVEIISGANCV